MSAVRVDLRCALMMALGLLASLLSRGTQGLRLLLRAPRAACVILGLVLLGRRHVCGAIGTISRLGRCVIEALRLGPARAGLDAPVTSLVVNTATAHRHGEGEDREQQHRSDDDQHGSGHGPVLSSLFGWLVGACVLTPYPKLEPFAPMGPGAGGRPTSTVAQATPPLPAERDDVGAEELRVAMQRYRGFLRRLWSP
jgi:hypothetical protein